MRGNKGEWSEVYVFLHLAAKGKLYTGTLGFYMPVLQIIKEEGAIIYEVGERVLIYIQGKKYKSWPRQIFEDKANVLLKHLKDKTKKGTFAIDELQGFLDDILYTRLSAPASSKIDIAHGLVSDCRIFY